MKANKLLVATALFTGFTVLSFAGPGPDYWARMNEAAKNKAAVKANARPAVDASAKTKPAAKPATEVATTCATCSCCAMKI